MSIIIQSHSLQAQTSNLIPQLLSVGGLKCSGLPKVRIFDKSTKTDHTDGLTISYTTSHGPNSMSYIGNVSLNGRDAAQFVLRYMVQDNRLIVTCEFREEYEGFELMGVSAPLVSASAEGGSLALPLQGGRLVDIGKSEPREFVQRAHNTDMPLAAMLRQGDEAALLELGSLDDNIVSAVVGEDGEKRAVLSVNFTHRYGPQNKELPSFRVTNRSDAFIALFEAEGAHWWTAGTKMLRSKVQTSIPPLYDGAVVYKIKLDEVDFTPDEVTTFNGALERVRQVYNYTAGAPQVAYLNGWQYEGHDTGYPDIFQVNKDCGTLEDMRRVIREGSKYNAVVSFHDNMDDAYTDSPGWEDEIISVDEHGKPKAGGVWGGGQAYIISPHKYIEHARVRLDKTVDMYGISKTIHEDVFSVTPDRYDFDPENPAGFAKSAEAKNYIARLFRERGLDMTSEGMCPAFAGNINYGWHYPDADDRFFSVEEQIPMLPFIYHGMATGAGGVDNDRHMLKHILWGLPFCDSIRKKTDIRDFMEKYYLVDVPYFVLANRTMQEYSSDHRILTIRYDGESYVRVNYDENTYEVIADGIVVARNFVTTAPMPQGGWVIYSRGGGQAVITLPDGVKDIEVAVLNEDEPAAFYDFILKDNILNLDAAAGLPYYIKCR